MTVGAVTVSTVVSVLPAVAFQVFCGEIDRWWRRDLNYRQRTDSVVRFTDAPNRKLVEVTIDGAVDLGEVTRWEPPHVLEMQWRVPVRVQPGANNTVEVRFEPVGGGTRVTVTHAGWVDLEPGGAAASIIGLWWSNPLVDYRAACASQPGDGS
jgi:uncharacterized protein YndB with AHSA1/START domain